MPSPSTQRALCACFATLSLLGPVPVRGENASTTVVTGIGPDPRPLAERARGAATTIDLTTEAATHGDLGVALATAPGTDVRRSGGPGAPAFVSIRGAAPWQTSVALDGIPLTGGAGGAVDLSQIPARMLDRVTVWRGMAPLALGLPGAGGTVHLETRFAPEPGVVARAGGASYLGRHAGVALQADPGQNPLLLSVHYEGSEGTFPWYDDRGTVFDTSDDRPDAVRRNAGFDRVAGLVRHRARAGSWRLTSLGFGTWQHNELPGLGTVRVRDATRERLALVGGVRAERRRLWKDRLDVDLILSTRWANDGLDDPNAEIGLSRRERRDRTHATRLAMVPTIWLHERVQIETLVEGSVETYGVRERRDPPPVDGATRGGGAAAISTRIAAWPERVHVDGGARVDLLASRVDGNPIVTGPIDAPSEHLVTGWVGAAWEHTIGEQVRVGAAVTWQQVERPPSFDELFGDRGDTVGNPALRPERRRGYEASVDAAWRDTDDRGSARVAWTFFDRVVDDLIVPVETGLGVTLPRNVARAALRGHEVALDLRGGPVIVDAAWTLLDALDRSTDATWNLRLPRRPEHVVHGGVTLTRGAYALGWRVDAASLFYLDSRERRPMPARVEHHLRVRTPIPWWPEGTLLLEGRNLGDRRVAEVLLPDGGELRAVPRAVADFYGQPIPGRAFFVTIELPFTWTP